MKNIKSYALCISFILSGILAHGQFEANKQIFKSPNLDKEKSKIKSVAILPFDIVLSFKKMPKGMTVDLIKEEEEKGRTEFQQGLYTYLLRIQSEIPATIQNPDRTNALLKKAGIKTKEDLESTLMDSLATILGVDALIKAKWNYAKTGSEGGAIAKAALLGFGGVTGSGSLILQVYNGKDGELLWRFYKEMNEGIGTDANDTMERMMRKVGRNFPLQTDEKK
jgi:hypothetical protein